MTPEEIRKQILEEFRSVIADEVRKAIEDETDAIASRVENRFYARVGKHALTQFLKLIGLVAVGAALFFAGKGALPT